MLIPSARAGKDPAGYVKKQDTWFADQEAKRTAVNILSQPFEPGGWPKHIDTTVATVTGNRRIPFSTTPLNVRNPIKNVSIRIAISTVRLGCGLQEFL